MRHLAGQQLGGGRHPEEGQELLEPADHLRLGVFDIKGSPLKKKSDKFGTIDPNAGG